uniref:Uncharacterized protein n=1 Tax=Oryza glaberrima TaxID=4538 RepID=I1R5D0_ORYGL
MGLRSALTLWTALKKRFEKLKYTILPQAGLGSPEVRQLQERLRVQIRLSRIWIRQRSPSSTLALC